MKEQYKNSSKKLVKQSVNHGHLLSHLMLVKKKEKKVKLLKVLVLALQHQKEDV